MGFALVVRISNLMTWTAVYTAGTLPVAKDVSISIHVYTGRLREQTLNQHITGISLGNQNPLLQPHINAHCIFDFKIAF